MEAELELVEELPRVRIDAERLRQVLINLCQNAAHAMEGRGKLTVRTREQTRDDVDGERRWVELWVSDTGPGIPQKVLANLFVPFVTTKNRGTGLGLAISQRIVNAAGGHIEVRSHRNVGTTFVVRLPAVDEPGEPTAKIALGDGASVASTKATNDEAAEATAAELPASLATSR